MSFFEQDYELPERPSRYMRLEEGDNKIRIMSSPIVGFEWWENEDGEVRKRGEKPQSGDRPARVELGKDMPEDAKGNAKHFWAMVVWSHEVEAIQILQLTQSTIQRQIKKLVDDDGWGNPKGEDGYDIVINREGEKLDTEYTVIPAKPEDLDEEAIRQYKESNINLEALYEGEDPFEGEKVDPDDVPDEF